MSIVGLGREQQAQQSVLMRLLRLELAELWRLVVGTSRRPAMSLDDVADLVATVAPLVQQYARASGEVARDYYVRQRREAGLVDRFQPPFVEPGPTEQIQAVTNWAVNPRRSRSIRPAAATPRVTSPTPATETPAAATPTAESEDVDQQLRERQLTDLTAGLERVAREPGRSTIEQAVEADPRAQAWARMTSSSDPCALCLVLESRGAVYIGEKAASSRNSARDPYHDNCACTVFPVFKDNPEPLPQSTLDAINTYYDFGAWFGGKDALNAMNRAIEARKAGRDVRAAVFDGYEHQWQGARERIIEKRRAKALDKARGGELATSDGAADVRFAS